MPINGSELRALRRGIRDVAQGISDLAEEANNQLPCLQDVDLTDVEAIARAVQQIDPQLDTFMVWLRGELESLRSQVQGLGNRLEAAIKVEQPVVKRVIGGAGTIIIFEDDLAAMNGR